MKKEIWIELKDSIDRLDARQIVEKQLFKPIWFVKNREQYEKYREICSLIGMDIVIDERYKDRNMIGCKFKGKKIKRGDL
jgi:hypothetical protein